MLTIRLAAAAAILAAGTAVACAQAAAPPGSAATVPEKTAPGTAPATDLDQKSGSLSKKLSDQKGVIRPSGDVDPDMPVGTPRTGTTPVIRPGETGQGVAK